MQDRLLDVLDLVQALRTNQRSCDVILLVLLVDGQLAAEEPSNYTVFKFILPVFFDGL